MRGGVIPLLAWAMLIVLLLALNWVWTDDLIQVAAFAFTALSVIGWGVVLIVARPREALRRGPPEPSAEPESVPTASYGSVLLAVGAATVVFGLVFGHFLIDFGFGVLAAGILLVAREQYAERRARRHWSRGRRGS